MKKDMITAVELGILGVMLYWAYMIHVSVLIFVGLAIIGGYINKKIKDDK